MVVLEGVCPLCQQELEDQNHLLWRCPDVQALWKLLGISLSPPSDTSHIKEWLVHKWKKTGLLEILGFVNGYIQELKISKDINHSKKPLVKELWRPPDTGTVKVNFDASFQVHTHISADAVIITNHEGQVMGACSYPHIDVADASVVEALACEWALTFAFEMGFQRTVVEGDSRTVINKLWSKEEDRSILRAILGKIKRLECLMEEVSYRFVPKETNQVAHALATEGQRWIEPRYWVEEAPLAVEKAASEDWHEWVHRHLHNPVS